jgi:hypothetical protein
MSNNETLKCDMFPEVNEEIIACPTDSISFVISDCVEEISLTRVKVNSEFIADVKEGVLHLMLESDRQVELRHPETPVRMAADVGCNAK